MKIRLGLTVAALVLALGAPIAHAGKSTANGWYEGQEIYYIDQGLEKNTTERASNQIYLIGGNRLYQANVVLHIPGEPGFTPHWNVNVVHTAPGVTVQDIINAGLSSSHFTGEGVIFDDAADVMEAERQGLVRIDRPGLVVLCPIVSEAAAEANGHTPQPETFVQLEATASF